LSGKTTKLVPFPACSRQALREELVPILRELGMGVFNNKNTPSFPLKGDD
jgi:hypothetical protein